MMKMKQAKICYLLIIAMLLSVVSGFVPGVSKGSVVQAVNDDVSRANTGWETLYFGNYWQSDTNGDGVADKGDAKEPIRWRVLTRDGNYALLLSDKILDAGKFYAGGDAASWEKSDVRNWLNTAFYKDAFSDTEAGVISVRTLSNEGNANTWGITTNATKDKVFLLSYDDVCLVSYGFLCGSYTDTTDTRTAATTQYAAAKPGMYSEAGSSDTWWLRNSGLTEETAYKVFIDGGVDPFNTPVNIISGIRPAIYVNLSDTTLWAAGEPVTAEKLPDGENINGSMKDDAGNLPITNQLPDWMGNAVTEPIQTVKPTDVPSVNPTAVPSVNFAHLAFTKQSFGGQVSSNQSRHNYEGYCSEVVSSYLEQMKDGTYRRVEACKDGIYIEEYSQKFDLEHSRKIEMPLPLFGGYLSGKNYNFLVFGQENPGEDDNTEIVRVVKYDKDWKELNSCSISGINTVIPFRAGSLRMTETDDVLFVHTCHQMYKSSDGLNHQANMTFAIDQISMEAVQKQYTVNNIASGYVSHSFNQFIVTDGDHIYRLDHGDAYPRSVVLTKCSTKDIQRGSNIEVLSINGEQGRNETGVAVGGLELKGNKLVAVGNSVDQLAEVYTTGSQRNIFVAMTDTGLSHVSIKWLTDYLPDAGVQLGNPQLVSCSEGYYVMWEEYKSSENEVLTKIARIDENGDLIGEISTIYARLSDCQPIFTSEKQLVWYTTLGSTPVFYCLDTRKLADYEYSGKANIRDCVITLEQDSYTYSEDASTYEPALTVKYGDIRLEEGQDYTVSYSNNRYPGTAKVTVKGNGFFEGEKDISFEIVNAQVIQTPKPQVTQTAKPGQSSGTTNKRSTTTVTRTTSSSATVYPGKVSGVKAKNRSIKAMKVTWNKAKNAEYYEIHIAKNRAFTKGKKREITNLRSASFVGLKKNVTYFVRVRAAKYSNGKYRYGKWSAVKKVRIRK